MPRPPARGGTPLRVPARYYLRLAEVLPRQGVDLRACLRDLGLSESELQQPDASIPFAQVDELINHLLDAGARSDTAFELGQLLSVSTHSIVGFGMLSCPTLEDALRFVARYFRLVMPSFRLRYTIDTGRSELLFTPVIGMSRACLDFHLEAIAIAALRDIDDLTGGHRPRSRLTLSMPEPAHLCRYRALRDVECHFDANASPQVRLTLFGHLRTLPLRLSDPNALQVAEERCRSLARQVTRVGRFSDWVMMTIREMGDGVPTLQELSKMLNLTTRTLNRYLEREGTCYRELLARVRFELACERLAAGQMSVTEIAYSLGFHDSANFARAFRAKAGCTPSAYRQRYGIGAADAQPAGRGSRGMPRPRSAIKLS
ncbi:AraC family transcriptional regulator [Sinimarinibacterium thermocellulolyticum]|uniref:AraC family transcriptional regulator ligand-binding domain-containing protein n=1 Tax=Sinimarinibacterium thermocellulolyticum TaxID=3170016 RepID=A0ABV2ADZ0_9GAMM